MKIRHPRQFPVALTLSALTVAMIQNANAQTIGPVAGPNGQQNVIIQPGKFEQEQYSKTQIHQEYFNQLYSRNKAAAEYYQKAVAEFETAFNDLQRMATETLIKKAQLSLLNENGSVNASEYAVLINNYESARNSVALRIDTIASLPDGIAGVVSATAAGSGVTDVPSITAGMDFAKIKGQLAERLSALESRVKSQKIRIKTKTKGVADYDLLDLSFVTAEYTGEEIAKMKEDSLTLKALDDADERKLDAYTNTLKHQLMSFITLYGVKEEYRWNMHDPEFNKRKEDVIKSIVDGFWQRSYLRMKYGVALGGFGVNYKTSKLGFDRIFANLSKIEFSPVIRGSEEIMNYERAMAEANKTADAKSKSFADIMSGKVGVITSANAILTTIMGRDQAAGAVEEMLKLMIRDMYEEKMLSEGRQTELVLQYKQRNYDTAKPAEASLDNPEKLSMREVTLMRELQFDYDATVVQNYKSKGLIPRIVVAPKNVNPETIFGQGQIALNVCLVKQADYANAARIDAQVSSYLRGQRDSSGAGAVDDLLGL